jgi:formylglycine-generating enzyme required for sulfatase activity
MTQEAASPEELARQINALQQQLQALEAANAAGQTTMQADARGESVISQGQDNVTAAHDSVAVGRDVGGSIVTGNNNSVTHIRHIYRQAPNRPALDEEGFNAALGRYLAWVERRYGRLDLRGVEKREQQVLSLTLEDVYVSLAAVVAPERKKQPGRELARANEDRLQPVDMGRLLALAPRLIITGGPGSGKSTFLHLIAATVARALRLNRPETGATHLGLAEPLPLPIVVSLSDYNRYRRRYSQPEDPRQGTLIAFISHSLIRQQAAIGLPGDFFERLLVQGQSCLLLLDGLDEVANERERALVRTAVQELTYNEGVRQIVVTSRTRAYHGQAVLPEEFRLAAVQPMTPEQVNALAARWCAAVYSDPTDAARESERLQTAVAQLEQHRQARQESRLADTPLMVTIIAIVHYNQRRLPEQRAELYDKCVEVLLTEGHHPASDTTYELADWGGTLAEKRSLLAYLAHKMMDAGEEAGRSVNERQIAAWLRPRLARRYGEIEAETHLSRFTQAMRERGSLLDERGGLYQFTHLTFQEFLCAYYLAETVRDPARIVAFLLEDGRLAYSWWRETILLTAGYLGLKTDEPLLAFLAELICLLVTNELSLAATELAGAALLELESHDSALRSEIVNRLVDLLTGKEVMAAPALRLLAGDTLGRLGDPRPGVCTLEPELIPIPAGPFLMGDEKLHEVTISRPYAIARYPVTNAQYCMFIEDGGYTEIWRHCWTDEGWRWREQAKHTRPYDDNGFIHPNQPRVGVNWYEAVAYARWLVEKTGKPYRLPTEAEWARAAWHTDGRTYPWGETWQHGLANTEELGLERTTAVGVFPQDRAECGAQDMAGNVGEWCQTRWNNEEGEEYALFYCAEDGRENPAGGSSIHRMTLGGTWGSNEWWSRCGTRNLLNPYYNDWNDGFRLVLSPFDSSL